MESAIEKGIIRLIDLLFVWKDGNLTSIIEVTQLDEEERMRFGAGVGGLIGYGAGGKEEATIGMEEGSLAAAEETMESAKRVFRISPMQFQMEPLLAFIIEHLWAENLKQALRNAKRCKFGICAWHFDYRLGFANDLSLLDL